MNEEEKDPGARNARRPWQNRVSILLPVAAIVVSIGFYCSLAITLQTRAPWNNNSISKNPASSFAPHSGAASNYGQGSLSIRLNPYEHIYRSSRITVLEWNITKDSRRPDGVLKDIYLVNGQFPGPTLEVRSGDEVLITILNSLENEESVAMHWHGLGVSNNMDGVPGLTQNAIPRGSRFTYRLRIRDDQAGTFWYHSHSETQRADGLYGPLIVHRPAALEMPEAETPNYADDQVLMIGDLYHRPATAVLEDFMDWKSYKIEPAPDSILLNGKGFFNCSKAVPARPVDCMTVEVPHLHLVARKTRLRLINTGALTGFTFSITGYAMIIIAVDGGNRVQSTPRGEQVGILYPGERVDIVIECLDSAKSEPGSLRVILDHENMQFPNLALTATQDFIVVLETSRRPVARENPHISKRTLPALSLPKIDLKTLVGPDLAPDTIFDTHTKSIVVYSTLSYLAINDNRPRGYINHSSWALEGVGNDFIPLLALEHDKWPSDPAPFIPRTEGASWIDLVINNMDDKGHPFHLHGNDFLVLAKHYRSRVGAYEFYNPFDSKMPLDGPLNVRNPVKKDTVYVPTMGYVVLRLKADRRGLWLLHCHVLWHQSVGMAMALEVG